MKTFIFGGLFLLGFIFYGCKEEIRTPIGKSKNDRPLLIMAQRPTPAGYPLVISKHMDHIESMPFDGMFINSPICWRLMNGDAVSYEKIAEELSPLKDAYKKFSHNFIYVFIDFPGDFWDDETWQITARNFGNMARVAKEFGFAGIVYDNEEYLDGRWLNYGEDYKNPDYDLEEHKDQVILRGKQVMEAMVMEFQDIEVFTYHGPYLSEPNYRVPDVIMGQSASWDHYELLGPFFVGMMLGKGEKGTIIDGGEVYQYRTYQDFKSSYQIRKYEIASEETDSWFIPYELRLKWPNEISIAFGVYNRQWKEDYPMNPEIMRTTLENALRIADKYVWYYTEDDNWLIPGEMPVEWSDMVKVVREKAINSDN